ncbi:hypothetical protein ACI8AA_23910 [Geodermatophilus sp. SYSU D01180]
MRGRRRRGGVGRVDLLGHAFVGHRTRAGARVDAGARAGPVHHRAPTTPAPVTPAAPVVDFAMPSVVGMTLQDAQDLIQTSGVFLSVSHDLLGARNQMLDANWKVCTQNVPAGQRVTGDVEGAIDLGVVKVEEFCP